MKDKVVDDGVEVEDPLVAVGLTQLMSRSQGLSDITIGLLDGPISETHPDLSGAITRQLGSQKGSEQPNKAAIEHGTFVAGILVARRGSTAPAICPSCTLLLRPVFFESSDSHEFPGTTPEDLADAVVDCVDHGARILNLSLAVVQSSVKREYRLEQALQYAAHRGVVVVAAAGNQGTVGSSAITRHPWVITVAACDHRGRPLPMSNLSGSIGQGGLMAPGERISSLSGDGGEKTLSGTSSAVPFVTGTVALLWSLFPLVEPSAMKAAVMAVPRNRSIVPPLLNALAAYKFLAERN